MGVKPPIISAEFIRLKYAKILGTNATGNAKQIRIVHMSLIESADWHSRGGGLGSSLQWELARGNQEILHSGRDYSFEKRQIGRKHLDTKLLRHRTPTNQPGSGDQRTPASWSGANIPKGVRFSVLFKMDVHMTENGVNGEVNVKGAPPPPSPVTGCYLLVVIGEPHSEEHKEIILQRIAKGK